MKAKFNGLDWAAWMFLVIGALNWGLVGAFKIDFLLTVLGTNPMLLTTMYLLIGVAGLYTLYRMLTMKN